MKRHLISLIEKYQKHIAPIIKPDCRFVPSCSNYAILSLKKYSLFHALFKIAIRLGRCTPFKPHGTIDNP